MNLMEFVLLGTAAYLAIGIMIGRARLARGIQGYQGAGATLVAWALLWPLVLLFEKTSR